MEYVNHMRNIRTQHSSKMGGAKKEKGEFPGGGQGSGKVVSSNDSTKSKGANFGDSDSFLAHNMPGLTTDDSLKSAGSPKLGEKRPASPKIRKGSKPPPKFSSNKGGGDKNSYYTTS